VGAYSAVGVVLEGRVAGEHLEEQDPEGPPISAVVVAAAEEHLRRHVLTDPAECVRGLPQRYHLGQLKVDQPDEPLGVKKDVLRDQVSVHYLMRV